LQVCFEEFCALLGLPSAADAVDPFGEDTQAKLNAQEAARHNMTIEQVKVCCLRLLVVPALQ